MWAWLPFLIWAALLIGLVVLVLVLTPFAQAAVMRRRAQLRALAEALGMQYTFRDNTVGRRFWFLNLPMVPGEPAAYHLLSGRFEGRRVAAFNCGTMGFVVLEHEKPLSRVRIIPEHLYAKLNGQCGSEEAIELESAEFSRAFRVFAADRKLAYVVCNPRVMEYLLEHCDLWVVIDGRCIALCFPRFLEALEIPLRLRQLVEIRNLLPDYLFESLPEERI